MPSNLEYELFQVFNDVYDNNKFGIFYGTSHRTNMAEFLYKESSGSPKITSIQYIPKYPATLGEGEDEKAFELSDLVQEGNWEALDDYWETIPETEIYIDAYDGTRNSYDDIEYEHVELPFQTLATKKHTIKFDWKEVVAFRVVFDSLSSTNAELNLVESISAERFVGQTFEAQRGISFIAAGENETESVAIDRYGIRGWKDRINHLDYPVFKLGLDGSFHVGISDAHATAIGGGAKASYLDFNSTTREFKIKTHNFLLETGDSYIDATDNSIKISTDNFTLDAYNESSGGFFMSSSLRQFKMYRPYSGSNPNDAEPEEVLAIGPGAAAPQVRMRHEQNFSNITFDDTSPPYPAVLSTSYQTIQHSGSPAMFLYRLQNRTPYNGRVTVSIRARHGTQSEKLADIIHDVTPDQILENQEILLTNTTGHTQIRMEATFDPHTWPLGINEYIQVSSITMRQYNSTVVINEDGIYSMIAPDLIVPLTGGQIYISGSGSSGISWTQVASKPFSSVGANLRVVSDQITTDLKTLTAGNGLTNQSYDGSTARTFALGTPSTISVSSSNTVGSTTHNHSLDLSGRTLTAGTGLTGGGNLGANRTFSVDTSWNAQFNTLRLQNLLVNETNSVYTGRDVHFTNDHQAIQQRFSLIDDHVQGGGFRGSGSVNSGSSWSEIFHFGFAGSRINSDLDVDGTVAINESLSVGSGFSVSSNGDVVGRDIEGRSFFANQVYSGSGYSHFAQPSSASEFDESINIFTRAPYDALSVGRRATGNHVSALKFLTMLDSGTTRGARIVYADEEATGLNRGLHIFEHHGSSSHVASFTPTGLGVGVKTPSERIHSTAFIRADSGYKVGSDTVIDSNRDIFARDIEGRDAEFRFGVFTQTGLFANTVYYPTYDLGDTGGGPTGGEAPDGGVYILLSSATTDDAPTHGVIVSRRAGNSHSENTQIHVSTFNDVGGNPSGGNFEFYGTYDSQVAPQKKVVEYNGHLYYALYIPRKSNDRFPSHWSFTGYHRKIQDSLTAVRADDSDLTDIQDFESHRDYSFYVSRHLDVADGIRMSGIPTIDSSRNYTGGSGSFSGRVTVENDTSQNHFRAIRGGAVVDISPNPDAFSGGVSLTLENTPGWGTETRLGWVKDGSVMRLMPETSLGSNVSDLGRSNRLWRDLHLGRDANIGRDLFVDRESFFGDDATFATILESPNFASGIFGDGWRIDNTLQNGSFLEVDNIRVRKEFKTHIFKKDVVRASNSLFYISDSSEITEAATYTEDQTGATLKVRGGDLYATFSEDDELVVRDTSEDYTSISNLRFLVTAVDTSDPEETVLTVNVIDGTSGTVNVGDTIVRVSGPTILLDAATEYAPFIDAMEDEQWKARFGNLSGISNATGFGIASQRSYLSDYALIGARDKSGAYFEVDGEIIRGVGLDLDVTSLPAISDEGLVGLWRFDGDALDSVSGVSSEMVGNPQFVQGVSGRALEFDGIDDRVVVANSSELQIEDELTISVWLYKKRAGLHEGLIFKWIWDQSGYGLHIHNSNTIRFVLPQDGYWGMLSGNTLDEDRWYHVVATYKSGDARIYIDGELTARDMSRTGPIVVNTTALQIGGSYSNNLQGAIDEVRIYNRVLTPREIKSLYLNPSGNSGGLISANQVRTGILQSQNENLIFDLDEGELEADRFTLSAGSNRVYLDSSTPKFALGANASTQTRTSGTGVFMSGGSNGEFRVGSSSRYFRWDGANIS